MSGEYSVQESIDLGLYPAFPMRSAYAKRWDKREDFKREIDCGWIGEDASGVWSRIHPHAALIEDDMLHDAVNEFWLGQTELTQSDYETKSNVEYQVKL